MASQASARLSQHARWIVSPCGAISCHLASALNSSQSVILCRLLCDTGVADWNLNFQNVVADGPSHFEPLLKAGLLKAIGFNNFHGEACNPKSHETQFRHNHHDRFTPQGAYLNYAGGTCFRACRNGSLVNGARFLRSRSRQSPSSWPTKRIVTYRNRSRPTAPTRFQLRTRVPVTGQPASSFLPLFQW